MNKVAARKISGPKPKRIRYAVVGLGHIAQNAVLPAFKAAAKNSEVTALVSGDLRKLKGLGKEYRVKNLYHYEEYSKCLKSGDVDAVFIALPNTLHCEYAVRAAEAGIHVLCEKPLAVTVRECQEMIASAQNHGIKLMTAYRLHFEQANQTAANIVKSGKIGEPRVFNSLFSFQVKEGNIRTRQELGGGPLHDIGIYCINAARSVFQAEPTEVFAVQASSSDSRFYEVPEIVGAMMRFPGERIANFVCSFGAVNEAVFDVLGTKGSIRMRPAFEYEEKLGFSVRIGEKEQKRLFPKFDQFGGELLYFSDCILKDIAPEPSGEEGLRDVVLIEAINDSALSGKSVKVESIPKEVYPSLDKVVKLPARGGKRKLVRVAAPHR